MINKTFDNATARSLAETVLISAEDGERMRGDILKIKNTIFKITIGSSVESVNGPVMLSEVNVSSDKTKLRADTVVKSDAETTSLSKNYAEQYNSVPRVVQ